MIWKQDFRFSEPNSEKRQCTIIISNMKRFFLQNQKFTYFWQFHTLSQSTSSEMTCLIQLPMIATWWRPHGCWWRQNRIVHMWPKVGPLVSIHSVMCSLPNPNCFLDMAWPCIALLTKNFGILPVDHMTVLHCVVRDSFLRKYSDREYETVKSKWTSSFEGRIFLYLYYYKPDESIPE